MVVWPNEEFLFAYNRLNKTRQYGLFLSWVLKLMWYRLLLSNRFKQNAYYILQLYRLMNTLKVHKMVTIFSIMFLYKSLRTIFTNIQDFE